MVSNHGRDLAINHVEKKAEGNLPSIRINIGPQPVNGRPWTGETDARSPEVLSSALNTKSRVAKSTQSAGSCSYRQLVSIETNGLTVEWAMRFDTMRIDTTGFDEFPQKKSIEFDLPR